MIDEMTIDISELLSLLRKRIVYIILSALICGILALLGTFLFIDKKYSSESKIYITPKLNDFGAIDFSALEINSKLVNNYIEIMQSDVILSKVQKELNLENTNEITNGLEIQSIAKTEVISISVTTTDPQLSCDIANYIVEVFSEEMKTILNIENITVLNYAKVEDTPVSPNLKINFIKGVLIGVFIPSTVIIVMFLMDRRLRNRNAVEKYLDIPVLTCIPYMEKK